MINFLHFYAQPMNIVYLEMAGMYLIWLIMMLLLPKTNHQYNMLRSIGWINTVFYNLQTFTRRRTQSDSFHLIHKDQGTA